MHLRGHARWLAAFAVPLAVGGALAGPGPAAAAAARPAAAGAWSPTDLSAAAGAPAAASAPSGYETDFARGPVPRVVYRTGAGHIEELSTQDDAHWQPVDLTVAAGAPAAASAPSAFGTDLFGENTVAHVAYRTAANHIEDLTSLDLVHWQATDLTVAAGAPAAAAAPGGYETNLDPGLAAQGRVARVVYRTAAGHIEELSTQDLVHWQTADLSAIAGGPLAASAPDGYQSDLIVQGAIVRTARVVYQDTAGRIEEIRQQTGGQWQPPVDLSALAGGPAAASAPSGYETAVFGQGATLRVVYRTAAGHIEELSLS